jgi:hypothetical protein
VFARAVERAGIKTGDVTLHTLRHTALSRMIAKGYDDYTVMEISGHSSTRVLARYTHPTEARNADPPGSFSLQSATMGTKRSQSPDAESDELAESKELPRKLVDGRRLELPTSALRTVAERSAKQHIARQFSVRSRAIVTRRRTPI